MKVYLIGVTLTMFHRLESGTPEHGWYVSWPQHEFANASDVAEFAGRACYQSWDRPNPETNTNKSYLAHIIDVGHFSVLEHNSFTFYITGVSRTLTHELIRHRHLSVSELSQRYVDMNGYRVVEPPQLRDEPDWVEANEEIVDGFLAMEDSYPMDGYNQIFEWLVEYKGWSRKDARSAARSQLPGSIETKIVITGNARTYRELIQKRMSPGADREIQLLARELLRQLKQQSPNLFQDMSAETEEKRDATE